jgi:mannose-1-phosphate guanylyltransferase/mannose-6-phosphate isomerase
MYAVILAGGGGTRLWPLSRRARPKPFLPLLGEESLFQLTLRRIQPLIQPGDTIVVAEQGHMGLVAEQAPQLSARQLIGEPVGRNTAVAIALAALAMERDRQDVMVVLPADHHIGDERGFRAALEAAAEAAQDGSLVTLGIAPTSPETGYGYVVGGVGGSGSGDAGGPGESGDSTYRAQPVERFVEKPPRDAAVELLASPGGAWWNAGIFVWRRDALLAGLDRYAPGVIGPIRRGLDAGQSLTSIYEELPNVSIDRALLEPASLEGKVKVVPADVGWSDVGSWDALHQALASRAKAADGVVAVGRAEDLGSRDVLAHSSGGRLVVTIGLQGTIVIDTPDVVLVCAADRAQEVRAVVDRLAQAKETDYL